MPIDEKAMANMFDVEVVNPLNTSHWMSKNLAFWVKPLNYIRDDSLYDLSQYKNKIPLLTREPSNNVKLLLRNTGQVNDVSVYLRPVIFGGNAGYSTAQSKWGTGSAYFDGVGDYLSIPYTPSLQLGTQPFTIEGWYYPTALTSGWCFTSNVYNDAVNGILFEGNATQLAIYLGNYISGPAIIGNHGLTLNNWHFIQLSRDASNVLQLRINGNQVGGAPVVGNIPLAGDFTIGNRHIAAQGGWVRPLTGYISDFRITIGETQPASVPTSLFSSVFPRGYAWELGKGRDITLAADYRYSGLTTIAGMQSGAVARSVCVWFKLANTADINRQIVQIGGSNANGNRFSPWVGENTLGVECVNAVVTAPWVPDTSWHSLIAVQEGTLASSVKIYIDGQPKTATVSGSNVTINVTNEIAIATLTQAPGSYEFYGLLDDLRIYNYALSATQAREIWQDSVGLNYAAFNRQASYEQFFVSTETASFSALTPTALVEGLAAEPVSTITSLLTPTVLVEGLPPESSVADPYITFFQASVLLGREINDAEGLNASDNARKPTTVNQQPGGGTNYPFIYNSPEITYLFSDFYLSYAAENCEYGNSFRIKWLAGFGTNPTEAPAGYPTQTHTYDLLIADEYDNTVLDTTTATAFAQQDWPVTTPRFKILEWHSGQTVCRAVIHTAWRQQQLDNEEYRTYLQYITPTKGELDPRTINKIPARVTSFVRQGQRFSGTDVVFENGFNTTWETVPSSTPLPVLESANATLTTGKRNTQRIVINAVAGSGLGTLPGCNDETPTLTNVNNVFPSSNGNLVIEATSCLSWQRPVGLTSEEPRYFRYFAPGVAFPANTLVLHNDCGPCCECTFYVQTYKGLTRQWVLYRDIAANAEQARNVLTQNITRWLAEKDCREQNPVQVVIIPEANCKVAAGVLFCNPSKCCIPQVTLRVTFETFANATQILVSDNVSCSIAEVEGSPHKKPENIQLQGAWPVFETTFDFANPQDTSRLSFRACVKGCDSTQSLRMYASIHFPAPAQDCDFPIIPPPPALTEIWQNSDLGSPTTPLRYLKISTLVPLTNQSAFCLQNCNCD